VGGGKKEKGLSDGVRSRASSPPLRLTLRPRQQGEWLRWSLFPFAAVLPSVVAKTATVRRCVP